MFCQSQVFQAEKSQILSGFFIFEKAKCLKKMGIEKSAFKKPKLATLPHCPIVRHADGRQNSSNVLGLHSKVRVELSKTADEGTSDENTASCTLEVEECLSKDTCERNDVTHIHRDFGQLPPNGEASAPLQLPNRQRRPLIHGLPTRGSRAAYGSYVILPQVPQNNMRNNKWLDEFCRSHVDVWYLW